MTEDELLDRMSSEELSAWMALAVVEAEEDAARRDDPEGWREAEDQKRDEWAREAPGILVREAEAPDDTDAPDDGD